MTEDEWLESIGPEPMLDFLKGSLGDRKLRLFAVGCCRRVWHFLRNEQSRGAVELAEKYADQLVTPEELENARSLLARRDPEPGELVFQPSYWACGTKITVHVGECTVYARAYAALAVKYEAEDYDERREEIMLKERNQQASLFRDIFGNPFRPVGMDPAWLTSTTKSVAAAIYAERAFDRMPILGDALEDAGCTNADILNHCRQPGEHVRGCWVVDLLLDKK